MASLIIIAGPDQGKEIQIQEPSFSLGRGKTADLCLNDHTISRTHAIISVKEGHFVIEDQHSINGIWVNEEKIASKELAHGDLIVLGNTHIRFMNPPSSSDIQIIDTGDSFDFERSIIMSMEEIENLKAKPTEEGQSREKDEIAQKNYQKLHVMLRISDAVANILDLKELISELMNVIFDETRASRGFIMLYDDKRNLVPVAVRKKNDDSDAITISKTIINTVVNQKKAILSSDMLTDQRFMTGASIIASSIRSCLCAPLCFHDEVFGVIHLDSDISTGLFSQDDLELLGAIAAQAALSIKNFKLLKQLTEEENKRSRLSQYFPPAQVEMLLKDSLDISLGGKTETVTMIFCDIRGFTSLSEGMKAPDVMNLLNDHFSVMTEIIFRFEGMVDNFMGDCILGVFGGPFKHEKAPERSVLAAIEMQKAMIELNRRLEKEGRKTLSIGIGVHSGEVSRGNIGSSQLKKYTVIGSNVNVCSRLCSIAKSGQILVSEATASHLASGEFKLNRLEPVKVRNVQNLITTYEVVY